MTGTLTLPRRSQIPEEGKDRINFRCEPDWYLAVAKHANSLGMDITNYLRFAVTKQMERDIAERENLRSSKK